MKTILSFLFLALSIGTFAQAKSFKLSWCDRNLGPQIDVKMEMSCLNDSPVLYNENGEALSIKNYRLEFIEDNLTLQCVRSSDAKLDPRVFGVLKQSTGFAKARIYDIIVTDVKGKVFRLDESYYFTITK